MIKRLVHVLLFLSMLIFQGLAQAQAAPFPGGYAVTIKGELASGVHFTRLAMYSFQPDGTMREDFWYWSGNAPLWSPSNPGDYGPTGTQVGYANQPPYASADQNQYVQGSLKFSGGISNVNTLYGKWAANGSSVQITWATGDTETWNVTWSDPNLIKIELAQASYVTGGMFLQAGGVRNYSAVNAGWGFGGPGVGFTNGVATSAVKKDLSGYVIRHNAWSCTDEPVSADQMNLASYFLLTTNNVLRYVTSNEGYPVFSYLDEPPANQGLLSIRVNYQTGHDFDGAGYLASNEPGHTYSGLQIIDMSGHFRGFVFSDSSAAQTPKCAGDNQTISSLYYLDTPTN